MATYCEYYGQVIEAGARFCTNCGAPIPVAQNVSDNTASGQGATIVSGGGNYSVVLISLGTCAQAAAADLLEDTLGYSETEAKELFLMLPAQIAQMLSRQQADYLAQAMTEYGMKVSVSNGTEYLTVDETSGIQSIFDKTGSFLGKALAVLGTITGHNRMRKFRKLDDPRNFERPYRPQTYRPAPPVHVRRNIRPTVQPKPVPKRTQNTTPMHQMPKPGYEPPKPGYVPPKPGSANTGMHSYNSMHSGTQQHRPGSGQMHGFTGRPDIRQAGNRPAGGQRHEGGDRNMNRH